MLLRLKSVLPYPIMSLQAVPAAEYIERRIFTIAVYYVPRTNEENWEEKYLVKKGIYLCYFCNKEQHIKKLHDYLKPCSSCGSEHFWA